MIQAINNFDPYVVGFGRWDIWIWLGILLTFFVVCELVIRLAKSSLARPVRTVMTLTSYLVFYGSILFISLNLFFLKNYAELVGVVITAFLPAIKSMAEKLYSRYDRFVDEIINKE
ncbi:MAG TPA: hypothetical protein VGD65_23070 [Chryseosolibacter sp.]